MASTKKLPDQQTLQQLVDEGLTNKQIGEKYGVTQEAVRQALAGVGIIRPGQKERPRYDLPWRVRVHHQKDYLARLLRVYRKRQLGRPLTATETLLLDQWIEWMERANPYGVPLTVHYDQGREPHGFFLKPRQPGDKDYMAAAGGRK